LEVGVLAMCVPVAQSVQSSHLAEFCVVEKLPDSQPEQVWSLVAEPALATNAPGAQVVYGKHTRAFTPAEK
jgi:hypothetical protein